MTGARGPAPFRVRDSALIALALGRSAQNLRELRDGVASVPLASLHHHFLDTLLRPSFSDPEYHNDFALWAHAELRDEALAEKLALVDPAEFVGGDGLRSAVLDILEDALAECGYPEQAPPGHEFQFLRSQIVIFDTGLEAATPAELAAMAPKLSQGSVFFHFVDARLRPPRGEDDFRAWLAGWGEQGERGRARLAMVDPSFGSLRELRARIARALAEAYGAPA